jgi:WhiB family transcriptional regulator, redox-sensing transcriptional regulator
VEWFKDAACATAEPELFFPVGSSGAADRDVEVAKAICAGCAVIGPCRDYAFATVQPFGVWGGLDEHERRAGRGARRLVTSGNG